MPFSTTTVEISQKITYKPTVPTNVVNIILAHQGEYNVNFTQIVGTLGCESSYNHFVYGDGGLAYGIAQFHKPTFYSFAKDMKFPDADYYDMDDQIRVMMWAFSKGLQSHWTCYTRLYTRESG